MRFKEKRGIGGALTALVILLVGCSGFVVQEPSPTQILSIRNTSNLLSDSLPTTYIPEPIIVVPDAQINILKRKPNPVSPNIFEPAPGSTQKTESALALGQVTRADEQTPPFDAFAKLRYLKAGAGYQCTAEFVGGTNDVLLTAGHCVFDNNLHIWHSNFRTLGRYNAGSSDFNLNWECAAIYSGWANGAFGRDYAFIKLRGSADKILGLRAGSVPAQPKSVGYPSNYFGGEQLAQVDGAISGGGDGTIRMDSNPFGPGSSGGAWIDQNSVVVGLNSFRPTSDTGAMWGPQFDADTILLYNFVRAGCDSQVATISSAKNKRFQEAKAVIEQDVPRLSPGPRITSAVSENCRCPNAKALSLANDAKYRYLVNYRISKFEIKDRFESNSSGSKESSPEASEFLACTRGDERGSSCSTETSISLASVHRIVPVLDSSKLLSIQSVSPSFCAQKCTDGSAGYCLTLGSGASPIVQSLSTFLTSSINRPPTNGVVATVREMITSFGGDADKIGNPCSRSAFYRDGDEVSNQGANCRVTTKSLETGPNALRLSLVNPTQTFAQSALSFAPAAKGVAASADRAVFLDRAKAPIFEFHGPINEDELNATFGGKVVAVERLGEKVVVTTENGCSIGESPKP